MPTHCMWGELFVVTRSQQERFVLLQLVTFVVNTHYSILSWAIKGNLQTHIVFPFNQFCYLHRSPRRGLFKLCFQRNSACLCAFPVNAVCISRLVYIK